MKTSYHAVSGCLHTWHTPTNASFPQLNAIAPLTPQKDLHKIKTVKPSHNKGNLHKYAKIKIYCPCRCKVHFHFILNVTLFSNTSHFPPTTWKFLQQVRLTYNTDLPDFNKGALDVLEAWQTFVQVILDDFAELRVTFRDGSKDPTGGNDNNTET